MRLLIEQNCNHISASTTLQNIRDSFGLFVFFNFASSWADFFFFSEHLPPLILKFNKVQQRQVQGPSPRRKNPKHQSRLWADLLECSSAERDLAGLVDSWLTGREAATCPCGQERQGNAGLNLRVLPVRQGR